jgi:hypothetical protein
MTKQELIEVAERCWQAAAEANLPGTLPLAMNNQFGLPAYDSVRLHTYHLMLTAELAPRTVSVKHEQVDPDAGAPWRESL